jgi:hypothetical protein
MDYIKCWALMNSLKRLGHEADYSPASSADVKIDGAMPPLPNTSSWRDV